MNTFAIWCLKKNKNKEAVLDVHLNLWKIQKKSNLILKSNYYYLDIGLMIEDISEIEKITIFIPFETKKEDVTDLGKVLSENHKLVNGIFNEDYTTENDNTPKQLKVNNQLGELQFIVYCLDDANGDLSIENKYNGSIININLLSIFNSTGHKKYYFRFRISSKNLNEIVKIYRSSNSVFESAFTNTEVIDFRLNEKRTYNESMSEDIINTGDFKIKKVHFLLLTSSSDDFLSNEVKATSRQLEKGLWNNYIDMDISKDNIVAYHWKMKDEVRGVDNFKSLIKLKVFKSNYITIGSYILVFGILTIIFNIISSIIMKIPFVSKLLGV